jgi:hypothetical protein
VGNDWRSRYSLTVDPVLARRWLAGHEAAGRRVLDEMRNAGPLAPDVSFAQAMELLELAPETDAFREADSARARAAWVKLRAWAAKRANQ